MLTLERFSLSPTETEGRLFGVRSKPFYTIEQPWRNNEPNKSCIPLGTYRLISFASPKFGPVFGLENQDLGVFLHPDPKNPKYKRSLILIHPANFASQLQGCIAVGDDRTFLDDTRVAHRMVPAVTKSRQSCQELFRAIIQKEVEPILEIVQRSY